MIPHQAKRGTPPWLCGAAAVAGWVAHDVLKFLYGRNAVEGLPLLLPSLLAVVLGGLIGLALGGRKLPATLALIAAAAACVLSPRVFGWEFGPRVIWGPRAVLLLLVAGTAARLISRWGSTGSLPGGLRLSGLRFGFALGMLSCSLACLLRDQAGPITQVVPLAAAVALAAALLPWRAPRWVLTAACVAWPLGMGLQHAVEVSGIRRPPLAPPEAIAANAPNLLLIVLDTVRADHLEPYGYDRVTTPALDAFVNSHCVRYEHARSSANYTLPAHASLFTGLFPAEHGADHLRVPLDSAGQTVRRLNIAPTHGLRDDVPTLAGVLRERGYRTAGVVANNAYLHHAYGLDRGFEFWDDRDSAWLAEYYTLVQYLGLGLRVGHIPYRNGDVISAEALAWVRGPEQAPGSRRPFFLMLNYMDAHSPYLPSRANRGAFSDEQPINPLFPNSDLFSLLYDRCLLDLDGHLDQLLSGLALDGLLEDTVVIITADHGEAFAEHGNFNHSFTVYDELVHVPLYVKPVRAVRSKLKSAPGVEAEPIRGVDLPALAMELLGLGPWPGAATTPATPGRETLTSEWYHSESNPTRRRWAAERGRDSENDLLAWVEQGHKWIVGTDGVVEVYDLERDPGEVEPLAISSADEQAALERAAAWWAANPPLVRTEDGGPALDAEHLERLRGLGYTGDD